MHIGRKRRGNIKEQIISFEKEILTNTGKKPSRRKGEKRNFQIDRCDSCDQIYKRNKIKNILDSVESSPSTILPMNILVRFV